MKVYGIITINGNDEKHISGLAPPRLGDGIVIPAFAAVPPRKKPALNWMAALGQVNRNAAFFRAMGVKPDWDIPPACLGADGLDHPPPFFFLIEKEA